jgi:anti-sigma regulatory factor (Ser/Thr protein kinase)
MTQLPASAHAEFSASCMQDLTALMQVLEQTCRRAGADVEALFSVRLAVEEVFTNVLQYGYRGGTGPVIVDIDARPERLQITLADAAPLFDPGTVPAPNPEALLEQRAEGGWGWHFVREVMDRVEWTPGVDGGNRFTLVKWLRHTGLPTTGSTPQ